MEKHQAKPAAEEHEPANVRLGIRHPSAAEERRERALHLAFAHMKGAHYDEVINAARAAEKYLKGE